MSCREKLPSQEWPQGKVYPNITCYGPGVGMVLNSAIQTEDLAKRELAPSLGDQHKQHR